MELNHLTRRIIGAAIEVHRELGPGKAEGAYEAALVREFELAGIDCRAQKPIPVVYKGMKLDCGYRLDVLVQDRVVVEVKSVETINPIHRAQVLTYLKLGAWQIALLLNFNVAVLKDGIHRLVLGLQDDLEAPRVIPTEPTPPAKPRSFHQKDDSGDLVNEQLASAVIGSAAEVHRELGPGLLPSVYEACLCHELALRGLNFERHRPLPLAYKGISLRESDEVRLLVGERVLVKPLALTAILPLHQAQLVSQLRLGNWKLGLLLNFDTTRLSEGIRRVVLSHRERTTI